MPVEMICYRDWENGLSKKKTELYAIYVKTHLKYDDIGLLKLKTWKSWKH